jgi:hypothetical protein
MTTVTHFPEVMGVIQSSHAAAAGHLGRRGGDSTRRASVQGLAGELIDCRSAVHRRLAHWEPVFRSRSWRPMVLRQVVQVAVGVAVALELGVAGASAHTGSAPRVAVESAGQATPEGCGASPSGCT